MKKSIIFCLSLTFSLTATAQKLSTRNAEVSFFSATPVEDIAATNKQVSSIFNLENGQFAFLVPIKAFQFEKALMQEHFNENYMESGQFPTAKFTGEIADYNGLDLKKDGKHKLVLAGTMTMHGVSQKVQQNVLVSIKDGKLNLESDFTVLASDYKVEIPTAKADNISNSLAVKVNATYE
jgi:polyisoprenoid-binding protein YceI